MQEHLFTKQKNNRLVFISGASSGLGLALARKYATLQSDLLLTSRKDLSIVKDELSKITNVTAFTLDLTKQNDLESLLHEIRFYAPDLIINNAGLGFYGDILEFPLEQQMEILQVNQTALVAISIEAARTLKMQNREGTILNIGSAAGKFIYPGFTLYASSKRFVEDFSLAFDLEMSPYGIRVLSISPGRFDTDFRYKAARNRNVAPSKVDTMSLENVVSKVIYQIDHKIPCKVIDFRYAVVCFFAKFLPKRWVARKLRNLILKSVKDI